MTTFQKTVKYLAITLAIFLILCIFGGAARTIHSFFTLFGGGRADAEPTAYSLSTQEIRSLDIELDAAHLDIVTGDSFSVEGSSGALNVGVTNGVLRISQKTKAWFWNRDLRFLSGWEMKHPFAAIRSNLERAVRWTMQGRYRLSPLLTGVIAPELPAIGTAYRNLADDPEHHFCYVIDWRGAEG